jgi:hypothetical protein
MTRISVFLSLLAFAYCLFFGAVYCKPLTHVAVLLTVLSIWCVIVGLVFLCSPLRRKN